MIQIQQLRLRPDHTQEDLTAKVRRELRLSPNVPVDVRILRQSVDAHRRPDIFLVYTVEVSVKGENGILSRCRKNPKVSRSQRKVYHFPMPDPSKSGRKGYGFQESDQAKPPAKPEPDREHYGSPVIVGAGPAGLFCALLLARAGLAPAVIERGAPVEERMPDVQRFWESGVLNPESNVQFGEGGAGTFSDGKLNTAIRDPEGRIRFVLETFVSFGADPEILYSYKPHIGTDVLTDVVRRIRKEIESLGGTFLFHCRLDDLEIVKTEGKVQPDGEAGTGRNCWKLHVTQDNSGESGKSRAGDDGIFLPPDFLLPASEEKQAVIYTPAVVLAIGHSARDTFEMLYRRDVRMTPKSFAVGLRIQHPQKMINAALYGEDCPWDLGPAPYKLTHRAEDGRGVYSFCMCPGGYVVNASSEEGMLAVNGMSFHDRAGENANSAIVVTVSPEDCRIMASSMKGEPTERKAEKTADDPADAASCKSGEENLFAGMRFQRMLERRAYHAADGRVPVQRYEDYRENRTGGLEGSVSPAIRGCYAPANVRAVLPEELASVIEEGIEAFSGQIDGFNSPDALLCGVESRTSSPVRIERDETLQAVGFPGLFPCGEGAGYAGGITSAAIDGIRSAEAVCRMLSGNDAERTNPEKE